MSLQTAELSPLQKVVEIDGEVESVVADAQSNVYFTDITHRRIFHLKPDGTLAILRENSGGAKGLALDAAGRLVVCEKETSRISRQTKNGDWETLAQSFEGNTWNHPNDVAVARDGSLYFTDSPRLKKRRTPGPMPGVYRIQPDGRTEWVASDAGFPNGIDFSPSGRTLYVADTNGVLWEHSLKPSGAVRRGGRLASVEMPDGLAVDSSGNLYVTEYRRRRILIISADGAQKGIISVPEVTVTNCFAVQTPEGEILWISAGRAVYRITLRKFPVNPAP